jgi:hypothetical protein
MASDPLQTWEGWELASTAAGTLATLGEQTGRSGPGRCNLVGEGGGAGSAGSEGVQVSWSPGQIDSELVSLCESK